MTRVYPDAEAAAAAVANVPLADARRLSAVPIETGGFEVDGPAEILAALDVGPSKERLKAYAAEKRWRVENGGTTTAGIPIATDDRSKMMVTGARVAADANPAWSTTWIGSDGNPYSVDATAMVAISDAVLAHINQSFAVFGALLTAIDAGAITSFAEVDAAAWPA